METRHIEVAIYAGPPPIAQSRVPYGKALYLYYLKVSFSHLPLLPFVFIRELFH